MVEKRPQIVVEKRPRAPRMRAGSHSGPAGLMSLWSFFDHAFFQVAEKKIRPNQKKKSFLNFFVVGIRPRIVVGIRPRIVVEKRPRALQRPLPEKPEMGRPGDPRKPPKKLLHRNSQKRSQKNPTTPGSNNFVNPHRNDEVQPISTESSHGPARD